MPVVCIASPSPVTRRRRRRRLDGCGVCGGGAGGGWASPDALAWGDRHPGDPTARHERRWCSRPGPRCPHGRGRGQAGGSEVRVGGGSSGGGSDPMTGGVGRGEGRSPSVRAPSAPGWGSPARPRSDTGRGAEAGPASTGGPGSGGGAGCVAGPGWAAERSAAGGAVSVRRRARRRPDPLAVGGAGAPRVRPEADPPARPPEASVGPTGATARRARRSGGCRRWRAQAGLGDDTDRAVHLEHRQCGIGRAGQPALAAGGLQVLGWRPAGGACGW